MKTRHYPFQLISCVFVSLLCGCAVTKNVCPKCQCVDYERDTFRDIGGGITNGMNNHGTAAAELGEQYTFWAATTFAYGGGAGKLYFRKVMVDSSGHIISVGEAVDTRVMLRTWDYATTNSNKRVNNLLPKLKRQSK